MKKIILASLLAATFVTTTFAGTTSGLQYACEVLSPNSGVEAVTFTATASLEAPADVKKFLIGLGADKIKNKDDDAKILIVSVKTNYPALYCEKADDEKDNPHSKVVCALVLEKLIQKVTTVNKSVSAYNNNYDDAVTAHPTPAALVTE